MQKRTIHYSQLFPAGTVGPQEIRVTTDKDMSSVEAIGFVEVQGSSEQYRLGLKNPTSGINIIDPVAKQLVLATPNVKNDDRYERLVGVQAEGKQYTIQVIFDIPSNNDVELSFAILQLRK